MDGHGSGQADLDVVGMRAEDEKVDGVDRVNSQLPTPNSQGDSSNNRLTAPNQLVLPPSTQLFEGVAILGSWELGVGN